MKRNPILGMLGKLAVSALEGATKAVLDDVREELTEVDARLRRGRSAKRVPEVLYRRPRSDKWEVVDQEPDDRKH